MSRRNWEEKSKEKWGKVKKYGRDSMSWSSVEEDVEGT